MAAACTGAIERAARQRLYGAPVRFAVQSRYQEIVLAGSGRQPLELFLNGRLAVCGADEYRGHEALVRPALAAGPHGRVLVLGGDGLAVREVLLHTEVRSVQVIEPDPALSRLARTDAALAALNGHAYADPRVHVVNADPLDWLRAAGPSFDVIVSDLPGPGEAHGRKYRTAEFYSLAARRLAPHGRISVRTGPVGPGLWRVEAGLQQAGLRTVPYLGPVGPPGCPRGRPGDQSYLLAGADQPPLTLAPDAPAPRALTTDRLTTSATELAALRPDHATPLSLLG